MELCLRYGPRRTFRHFIAKARKGADSISRLAALFSFNSNYARS